jgi:D-alanine-D-alanine ligase
MGIRDSSLVSDRAALRREVERVHEAFGEPALVEEFLPGREFTMAVLGNGAARNLLPIVEVNLGALPPGASPIYSYEAKWIWDTPERPLAIFRCPAEIPETLAARLRAITRDALDVLRVLDWCRVDLRLDAKGEPHVLELNPLPGILPDPDQNSCFPKAARAAGISYSGIIHAVVDAAAARLGLPAEAGVPVGGGGGR